MWIECQDLLDVAGRSRLSHVNADIDRIIQGRKQLDMDFTEYANPAVCFH